MQHHVLDQSTLLEYRHSYSHIISVTSPAVLEGPSHECTSSRHLAFGYLSVAVNAELLLRHIRLVRVRQAPNAWIKGRRAMKLRQVLERL